MSQTIDSKVVEMKFDNQQFEQNVKTTMDTVTKFKGLLGFEGASSGLEKIGSAVKGVNFDGLSGAVQNVHAKFSALEVVAITALSNITNSVVNLGKNMLNTFTVKPIYDGFSEYELKMGSVQTIMASTGKDIDTVNGYLEMLNTYSDKTIYSFSDMTASIGKFTNAGVDLDSAVKSIQGISNEAAVSGANAAEASRAMYNFAQALSSGAVKLIDWKSIENANMATVEFKQQLIDTAVALGTVRKEGDEYISTTTNMQGKVSEAFTATHAFNDSLSAQWMTSDVLIQTLGNYATDIREMSDEEVKAYEKKLKAVGYTNKQIKAIEELGQKAFDSAQDVKTFTQLMDTLKEAAGSGWSQTFEIIFGNLEEAKKLWTGVSKVVGGFIDQTSNARNEVLKGWKELGGRDRLIQSVRNAFNGLLSIVKPIKEAFDDIFPPITAKRLYYVTYVIKRFTDNLKLSDDAMSNLHDTFRGIFSIFDIIGQVIGTFIKTIFPATSGLTSIAGGILEFTGSIGRNIAAFDEWLKKNEIFAKVAEKLKSVVAPGFTSVKDAIDKLLGSINNFVSTHFGNPDFSWLDTLGNKVKSRSSVFEKLGEIVKAVFNRLKDFLGKLAPIVDRVGGIIMDTVDKVADALLKALHGEGFDSLIDLLNGGLMVGIGAGIMNFIKNLKKMTGVFGDAVENVGGIKGLFNDLQKSLKSLTDNIKYDQVKKLATAIAILAGSLFVISLIDSNKLTGALGAVSALMAELTIVMAVTDKFSGKGAKNMNKSFSGIIKMSAAILILAVALKKIADIKPKRLWDSMKAISLLVAEMTGVSLLLSNFSGKSKGIKGMIAFAASLLILTESVKRLADMKPEAMWQGIKGISVLIGELAAVMAIAKTSLFQKGMSAGNGLAMIELAAALLIMQKAVLAMAQLKPEKMTQGLTGIGVLLVEVLAFTALLGASDNVMKSAVAMVALGTALVIMSAALKILTTMSPEQLGMALLGLGVALAEIVAAFSLLNNTKVVSTAAAMVIMGGAMVIMAGALKLLGSMSIKEVVIALVALGGALLILADAAGLFQLFNLVPTLIGMAAALALLGIAVAGVGAGILMLSAGLTALAVSGVAGASALIAILEILIVGVLNVIAGSAKSIANAIKAVVLASVDVLTSCAPAIAEGALSLIKEITKSLATNAPEIVDNVLTFIIGVFKVLRARLPELISEGVQLVGALLKGIFDAFSNIDTSNLEKVVIGAGILTAIMIALGTFATLLPSAMAGVIGLGAVMLELTAVFAVMGGIAQIPGLEWLIEQGGNFGEKLGTAVGKLIGGVLGGIAEGATSTLPEVGNHLSEFMENMVPFFDSLKNVKADALETISKLTGVIIKLTGANVLDGITSWITGKSSIDAFSESLPIFAQAITNFSDNLGDSVFDTAKMEAANTAALAVVSLQKQLDGVDLGGIFKSSDLKKFSEQIVSFGKSVTLYSDSVKDVNTNKISSVSKAVDSLKNMLNGLNSIDISKTNGFIESLHELSELDFTGLSESMEQTTTSASKVSESASKFMAAFAEGMTSNADKAIDNARKIADQVLKELSSKVDGAKACGRVLLTEFSSGLGASGASEISGKFTEIINQALEHISKLAPSYKSAGQNMVVQLASGFSAGKSTYLAAVSGVIAPGVGKVRGQYYGMYSAGLYLCGGLALGISRGESQVINSISRMANNAIKKAKEKFDINSPSKVFYSIGESVIEGLTDAVYDGGPDIDRASAYMTDKTINGMNNAIGKIAKVIDGDLDVQPVISPVVDLTNLRNSTNDINSMFNLHKAIDITGNVNKRIGERIDSKHGLDLVASVKGAGTNSGLNNFYINVDGATNPEDFADRLVRRIKMKTRTAYG